MCGVVVGDLCVWVEFECVDIVGDEYVFRGYGTRTRVD